MYISRDLFTSLVVGPRIGACATVAWGIKQLDGEIDPLFLFG